MPYVPMTLEEMKEKQKIIDEKLANTPPSHLHRIKNQWVKTKSFRPWFNGKVDKSLDINAQ